MNIQNLYIGQEIKNYKELCELLGVKAVGGKSKQLQLKEFQRHFKWHNQGHKIIIDEVYRKSKPKQVKQSLAQRCNSNVAKMLLSDIYLHMNGNSIIGYEEYENVHHDNKFICTTNELLKSYNLINDNTLLVKNQSLAVANYFGEDYYSFQSSVDLDYKRARSSLDSAFRSLKNVMTKRDCYKLVIVEQNEVLNEHGEIEIVKEEKQFISTQCQYDFIKLSAYNSVLAEFGVDNLNQLYTTKPPKVVKEFYYRVNEWVRENCTNNIYTKNRPLHEVVELEQLKDLHSHYQRISISYDKMFIEQRYFKDCLTQDEVQLIQDKKKIQNTLLPQIVKDNMATNHKNAVNRHNNAKKKDDTSNLKKNDSIYEQTDYLEVHNVVNDMCHNPKTKYKVTQAIIEQEWERANNSRQKMLDINNQLVLNKRSQDWINSTDNDDSELEKLWDSSQVNINPQIKHLETTVIESDTIIIDNTKPNNGHIEVNSNTMRMT